MPTSSSKLPLTQEERARLRSYKVKLKDIAYLGTSELSDMLASTLERAQYLRHSNRGRPCIPVLSKKIAFKHRNLFKQ